MKIQQVFRGTMKAKDEHILKDMQKHMDLIP